MIELDGSHGEGGGQVLRTALTLSMITGQPFRMTNIRAKRPKPGLMRQHLVAVQASAAISDAQVINGEIGARELTFIPQRVKGGDYSFAIGTAGSCTLVLQTLVPALLYADARATVRITGGTHNPMAPPTDSCSVRTSACWRGWARRSGSCWSVAASIRPAAAW